MSPQDCAVWSHEEHRCVDFLDQRGDSFHYCCGGGESFREGLHVLVGLVVSHQAL